MQPSKKNRWIMFNQISKTYDLINRFITFGLDISWRNAMIECLPQSCSNLLDIASGTMDVAIAATKKRPDIISITALDMAKDMLHIGDQKCKKNHIKTIHSKVADVHNMPFDDNSFDAATVSFGIRNFENLDQAFSDTCRVIKPNGSFIILESCQPSNRILILLNNLYLKIWVRGMGALLSGNGDSYGYLANSIQTFHSPQELQQMLIKAGFKSVSIQYFMCQSVQLIHAVK